MSFHYPLRVALVSSIIASLYGGISAVNVAVAQATTGATNTVVVNSLADDGGNCPGSHCTLRAAIDAANNSAYPTVITFSISGVIPISSVLAFYNYRSPLNAVLDGGNQNVSIDGENTSQVFLVSSGQITFRHLMIENGRASQGAGVENEGGDCHY